MKGVTADLVILNAKEPSYVQDLNDQIVSIVRSSSEGGFIDRPGGVFVRRTDTMPPEDVALLHATARVHDRLRRRRTRRHRRAARGCTRAGEEWSSSRVPAKPSQEPRATRQRADATSCRPASKRADIAVPIRERHRPPDGAGRL